MDHSLYGRCYGAPLGYRMLLSMMVPRDRRSIGLGFLLSLLIFFVDQLAKYVVVGTMRLGEGLTVVPGILGVIYAQNPCGAAGILRDRASLLLLACIVSLAALVLLFRSFQASLYWRMGSGLLFGGAASNLVDRLFRGAVVDYVHLVWWVFNGADIAMALGAGAMTFSVLRSARSR